jgi:methylated-DNA-[protein]-cysteine S-methyltransferase
MTSRETLFRYDALHRTPFAVLGISTVDVWVTGVDYLPVDVEPRTPRNALAHEVVEQVERYLEDPGFRFELPLKIQGSEFRKRVWDVMCAIPAGQTLTYGDVAKRLDSAARAVGGACGDNRIPLIIPCHRIVARGGIGGFMHTTGERELNIKRWLLAHEQGASLPVVVR